MKHALLVLVVVLVALKFAEAHHSYADFSDQPQSIAGTIQAIEFASPHTMLTVAAKDGTVYKAVWNAVRQLEVQGVERTALKVGDTVLITGHPHKDASTHEFAKLREVRRTSDGWTWRSANGRVSVTGTH